MSGAVHAVSASPIIFTGDSVRAILARTKTQTRRLRGLKEVNAAPDAWKMIVVGVAARQRAAVWNPRTGACVAAPYAIGDRLWVRETWVPVVGEDQSAGHPNIVYRAHTFRSSSPMSGVDRLGSPREVPCWRSPLFMPRWASRLMLEVTAVRAERLIEITEEDARAEGVEPHDYPYCAERSRYRMSFARGWDEINGKRAPWRSNPWCWVLTFRRIEEARDGSV